MPALMDISENKKELERREKEERELKEILAELDTRLNSLQSSAFKLANYYFVFQGVILTIICNALETTLKKSDRWFLFSLSLLAVLLNSVALIKTGIEYIRTKADREVVFANSNEVYNCIVMLERKIHPSGPNRSSNEENEKRIRKKVESKGYTYLAICMIFFLAFAAVVFVGCWKFLGTQNEVNRPSNDKCIRLCNGAKCLNICSEYRYSSKIQASSMHNEI